nr:hypothetical protein CPAG_05509 [Coccidioides posadasii RMSCC 3488]
MVAKYGLRSASSALSLRRLWKLETVTSCVAQNAAARNAKVLTNDQTKLPGLMQTTMQGSVTLLVDCDRRGLAVGLLRGSENHQLVNELPLSREASSLVGLYENNCLQLDVFYRPLPTMPASSANYHDVDQDDSLPLLVDVEETRSIKADEPPVTYVKKTWRHTPSVFVLLIVITTFVIDFGVYLNIAPQTRILESIACRNYYDKHEPGRFGPGEIPEDQCKIKPIQGEVAFVQAMMSSFDAIPSIILLIPYGRLADNPRFGRKLILLLSVLGVLLSFYWVAFVLTFPSVLPLRAVWFGSIFNFIGGGLGVINAMVMTMITDVVDPDNRTNAFSKTTLAVVVAQLIAPSVSSGLMNLKGPWLPYLSGIALDTITFPFLFIIPETIQLRPPPSERRRSINVEETSTERGSRPDNTSYLSYPRTIVNRAWESSKFIFESRAVVLILSAFLLTVIGRKQIDILLLYASTRYSIPISAAAFSLSVFAGGNIFLLLVLLPFASHYLTKKLHYSSQAKDLYLSQASIIILSIGSFALGVSPTMSIMLIGVIIYTLGCGFLPSSLSLISTFVEPRHSARMYSIVCLVSMVGALIGGPFIALLFDWGLGIGPAWTGLAFIGTGLLHVAIAAAITRIKLPRGVQLPEERQQGESPRSSISLHDE